MNSNSTTENKTPGKLIILEGGEGSGKSSALKRLAEVYGDKIILTREPGGTSFAEEIRNLALKSEGGKQSDAATNFAMMWASRAEHLNHKIRPALAEGIHVVSDRFDSSTWAYQLYGQEGSALRDLFPHMRKAFLGDTIPVMYIYLDVDPAVGLQRKVTQNSADMNHFDDKKIDFHLRVREGYMDFLKDVPHKIIDANQTEAQVQQDFLDAVASIVG